MNWVALIELILIFIIFTAGLCVITAIAVFLMVLIGRTNTYGEYDALMSWLKKIFRTGGKKK